MVMAPLNAERPAVQLLLDRWVIDGTVLMVMLKVCVASLPALSSMVMLPAVNALTVVGVPVKLMVLPVRTAVRPVGSPLSLTML